MSCPQCGPVPQKSFHYDHEYHTSPSLQRLRSSNLPATDDEITHVQTTFLSDIHCDRVSLEARLAALSRVVASMKEECDALRTLENQYQSLISARRAIPHELWPDIFLDARSYDEDFDCRQPSGAIWQLSHVCQAWRDVALSLDSFWSRITIGFGKIEHTEASVQLLQLVLSRSKLLDINLCRPFLSSIDAAWDAIDVRMLDMVLSQSHRWRSAQLDHDSPTFAEVYAPIRGRLPQLSSLTIRTYFEADNAVQLFEDCPLLTKVTLTHDLVSLPVAQIRELEIGIGKYRSFHDGRTLESLELISRCPQLEILDIVTIPEDEQVRIPLITTPNIYKLQTNSGPIMNNLVIPLLREAILFDSLEPNPHVLQSFKQLLCRSDCMRTLTRLRIVGLLKRQSNTIGSCPLLSILVETTRLTVLELDLSRDVLETPELWELRHVAELMRALQVPAQSSTEIVLPCLSSLTIVMVHCSNDLGGMPLFASDDSDASWGDFVGMLKARWEGAEALGLTRLRTFHVTAALVLRTDSQWAEVDARRSASGGRLLSCEDFAILDGLVEAGMDLEMRFTLRDTYNNRHPRRLRVLEVPTRSVPTKR